MAARELALHVNVLGDFGSLCADAKPEGKRVEIRFVGSGGSEKSEQRGLWNNSILRSVMGFKVSKQREGNHHPRRLGKLSASSGRELSHWEDRRL